MIRHFGITLVCAAVVLLGFAPSAAADETPEQIFNEFREIVKVFPVDEQIASWEAFIMKYPESPYVSTARAIISDLKRGGTGSVSTPTRTRTNSYSQRPKKDDFDFGDDGDGDLSASDMDLDFVEGTTERASNSGDADFFDDSDSFSGGSSSGSSFDDGFETPAGETREDPSNQFFGDVDPGSPAGAPDEKVSVERPANKDERLGRSERNPRRRSTTHAWGTTTERSNLSRNTIIEVAPFAALSPDEVYVRNTILGAHAGVHFGERWFAEAELAGVIAQQTPVLLELKDIDAQPEVLMGYRFLMGGGVGYKLFSGPNHFKGGGHDIFARGGAGLVNSDVEVCYENEQGIKCAQPQVVNGWFPYGTLGLGYRYYFSPNVGLRADVRYRAVMEIVDTSARPRGNFQVNLGASFSF